MTKIYRNLLFIGIFLLQLFIISCSSNIKLIEENVADQYIKTSQAVKVSFTIFNTNDTLSQLNYFIDFNPKYFQENIDQSNYFLKYRVFVENSPSESIINGMVNMPAIKNQERLIGNINLALASKKNYLIEIKISNLNNELLASKWIRIEKTNINSRENFLILNEQKNDIIPGNFINYPNKVFLKHTDSSISNLFVKHYTLNESYAPLPFATEEKNTIKTQADSSFVLVVKDNCFDLNHLKKGIYYFQADTSLKGGFTLFVYDEHFPELKSIADLIYPLIYITNSAEFSKLKNTLNQKEELDQFWLQLAGNQNRAKELIKNYYNRVKESNEFFTSFTEGWKTDRGMIYIIFGPPNVVYKYPNSEIWIYGEEKNMTSLTFSFFQLKNPFCDNDFLLDRAPIYRINWYQAVDTWRQGRVY